MGCPKEEPMKRRFYDRFEEFQERAAQLQFVKEAGLNPGLLAAASRFKDGRFGLPQKAQEQVLDLALLNYIRNSDYTPPGDIPPEKKFVFGTKEGRNIPIVASRDVLPSHLVVAGRSRVGKSNFLYWLIKQLRKMGIKVRYVCLKGEGRRMLRVFAEAMLFWLRTFPRNPLEFVGDRTAYWLGIVSEIANAYKLRPETYPLLLGILERIFQALKKGEPFPSWEDFRRVVENQAKLQGKENLYTAARTLFHITVALGQAARIRQAPDIRGRYGIEILELVGVDPRLIKCILGFDFTRLLLEAAEQGHTTELREVLVIDEGAPLFSRELREEGAGYVDPMKRYISMAGFAGTGLCVGIQNLSQTDPFVLGNCGVFVCFQCASYDDAVVASKMLCLPRESIQEIMSLPVGTAFVLCAGWERAVKVTIPLMDMGPYPSDQEVRRIVQPELDWIEQRTIYAEYEHSSSAPIDYHDVVGEKGCDSASTLSKANGSAHSEGQIFEDHFLLMDEARKFSSDGLRAHYSRLGWGVEKGNRILRELKSMGCVVVNEVKAPGQKSGRSRLVVVLTEKGVERRNAYARQTQ